ncbi:MAG: histone deacetylase [Gemmatimonadetes bacterium]|nr:histone deacetylase [Gemmatimonadota bacterium]
MTLAFISHPDGGRHDTGWNHPEHVGRLRAIPRALKHDVELFQALLHHEPRHATPDELALAHDPGYVEAVRRQVLAGGGRLDADTVASEGSWDAARAATGAVLDGIDMALDGRAERSFCAVRPPGHHALRDRAMGFCLFGSVAIGARYALSRPGVERVLIIDWDVHHGNGTEALVREESRIRFVSMHQYPWYPGTGEASEVGPHRTLFNVPMAPGLRPQAYVDALLGAIDRATTRWSPDLVLISAGFDSLRGDPLGGFTLEMEHVDLLTRAVVTRAAAWCGGRVVSALEGGYDPDRLGEASVVHMRALAGLG